MTSPITHKVTVPTVENFEKELVCSCYKKNWFVVVVLAGSGVRRDRPTLYFQADSSAYLK